MIWRREEAENASDDRHEQTRGRAMAEPGYEVDLFGIAPIVAENDR